MESLSSGAKRTYYAFGPFVLDPVRRLLWRERQLVPLTSRAFDVLLMLVEHRHGVVDKDVLLSAIWGDTVVEEATVVRHISTLRKALQLRPHEHDLLVTIPGRGYRFVAEASELDELPAGLHAPSRGSATNGNDTVNGGDIERAPGGPAGTDPDVRGMRPAADAVDFASVDRVASPPSRVLPGLATGLLALAIAVLTLVATWWVVGFTTRPSGPLERQLRQFTFDAGVPREPTWSPDGRALAYTSDRGGNPDIWVQSVADPNPVRLTSSPSADWQADWSSDGAWLVFRSERDGGGLYVVPSGGGAEERITTFGYLPKWSPDGKEILFSSTPLRTNEIPRLYVARRFDRAVRTVRADLTEGLRSIHAGWHPDGRISISGDRRGSGWTFMTAPLTSGPVVVSSLPPGFADESGPGGLALRKFIWSRSGRQLYFEGAFEGVRNLWRVSVDRRSLAWTAEPERLTTSAAAETEIALSPDGSRLAFRTHAEHTRFWSFPFDRAGTVASRGEPLTSGEGRELQPDVPTAGDKLLYQAVRGTHRELRELSLVDRREQVLVSGTDHIARAVWSPDGSRLAYVRRPQNVPGSTSSTSSGAEVIVLGASGAVEARYALALQGGTTLLPSDWAPDGRSILGGCRSSASQTLGVCLVDLLQANPEPVVITSHPQLNLFQQHFSPDSRWITFMAVNPVEAGASTIYVVPALGGAWTAITEGRSFDDKPTWSADGRTLYYLSNNGAFFNVWGRRFEPVSGQVVGQPFRVTSFNSPRLMISPDNISSAGIAVTADRLVLPITEEVGQLWVLDGVGR